MNRSGGPGARVVINVDHAEVGMKKACEGHGEEIRAMLDLSVGRLDAAKDTVRGWLRVDGSRTAGHSPAYCPPVLHIPFGQHESIKEGSHNAGFPFAP